GGQSGAAKARSRASSTRYAPRAHHSTPCRFVVGTALHCRCTIRTARQAPLPTLLQVIARSNRRVIPDRHDSLEHGVPWDGIDLQPAADLAQALAHARKAHAMPGPRTPGEVDQAPYAVGLRHADAGVLDGQHDVLAARRLLAREPDRRNPAAGVARY